MTNLLSTEVNEIKRPPNTFRKVAIASKVHHAPTLVKLWREWPQIHFTSHWPMVVQHADGRGKPATVWQEDNFAAITQSEFLMVYAEDHDDFKGGLVEIGWAFACRIPIYVCGMNRIEQLGEWQLHNQVRRRPSKEVILQEITDSLNYK